MLEVQGEHADNVLKLIRETKKIVSKSDVFSVLSVMSATLTSRPGNNRGKKRRHPCYSHTKLQGKSRKFAEFFSLFSSSFRLLCLSFLCPAQHARTFLFAEWETEGRPKKKSFKILYVRAAFL